MDTTELQLGGLLGLAVAWETLAAALGALLVGLGVGTVFRLRAVRRQQAAMAEGEREQALRLGRLMDENRERLGERSALLRAATVVSGELELTAVLQRLADEVAALLQADASDCYLYDRERGVLRCAAVHGLDPSLVGFEFPAERGLSGLAIREGHALVATEYGSVADEIPHPAYAGFSDAIVAPMRWSDEVRGVLGVGRRESRPYGPHDSDVLEAFAALASLAIRNAETFSRSEKQARVQRGFYRIAAVLGQSLSRAATLDAVAQAATEALGGAAAAALMPVGGGIALSGSHDLPPALVELFAAGPIRGTDALVRSASNERVVASPNLADDERVAPEWRAAAAQTGLGALLSVPVVSPRDGAGGLVAVFFEDVRSFSDDDLELARHLSGAARGALERSELYEAERSARALAQQLARTGGMLTTELDPEAVLDEVVDQARELLKADGCAIRVLKDGELVVSAASGLGSEAAVGSSSSANAWLSGDVVQSRASVALEDAGADPRLRELDPMLAAGNAAYLGVPLAGSARSPRGVLALYDARPRVWREEEIDALLALAASTSAALANAELYQRVALERERSVAILANIADGIVAVDRDGTVVLWNAAAEKITGVPAMDALGRTPVEVLERKLESDPETPPDDRLVPIMRGREEVWLSVSEAVMRDPVGAVAGRIFAFRDISADRLVEQMKSDFVSTVSHELRTPLTSIYGFAETLLRQDVLFGDEERTTFLGYIASESQRLTQIVDALLNVARLDTGDLQVRIASTDVRRAGRRGRAEHAGRVVEREIVRRRPPGGPRRGEGRPREAAAGLRDPARQRGALLARRRHRAGGSGAQARHGRTRRRGPRARYPARRPGADLPKVLPRHGRRSPRRCGRDRPRPVHRPRSRDRHGWKDLRQFPRRRRIDVRNRATARRGPVVIRVLVIDDEAPIRLLCRVNLEAEGMEVIEAGDGPSGLELARDERPDVVLLDVMMPRLDGWRVAEELLEDERTSEIPIIFLTARAEFRDRARGLDIGGIDYVTKPFNPLDLAPLVRELLDRIERGERDELRGEKLAELRSLMQTE